MSGKGDNRRPADTRQALDCSRGHALADVKGLKLRAGGRLEGADEAPHQERRDRQPANEDRSRERVPAKPRDTLQGAPISGDTSRCTVAYVDCTAMRTVVATQSQAMPCSARP